MLQQILKDMYIDPDVLNALNEDQKKTLFLKMRQEQVRRWKEQEEKLEKEERGSESKRPKPKKGNSKSVSWMLGRDGDVAVIVIGEEDELTSRFICSGLAEKKKPSLQNNTCHQTILKSRKMSELVRTESENLSGKTQPDISLNRKPELKSAGASEERSSFQPSICSRPPARASPVNMRPASANVAPGYVNTRTNHTKLRLANSTSTSPFPNSTDRTDLGKTSPTKDDGPSGMFRKAPSKDAGTSVVAPTCAGRGRVAQLMKAFSVDCTTSPAPSCGIKPPVPSKPDHLHVTTTPSVR